MIKMSPRSGRAADRAGDIVAVHPRQADIEHDRIRSESTGGGDRVGAVVGDMHLVPSDSSANCSNCAASTLSSTMRQRMVFAAGPATPVSGRAWRGPGT